MTTTSLAATLLRRKLRRRWNDSTQIVYTLDNERNGFLDSRALCAAAQLGHAAGQLTQLLVECAARAAAARRKEEEELLALLLEGREADLASGEWRVVRERLSSFLGGPDRAPRAPPPRVVGEAGRR